MSKQLLTNIIFYKNCHFRRAYNFRNPKLVFNSIRYNSEQNAKIDVESSAYSDDNLQDKKSSWGDKIIYNTFLERYRPPRSWRVEANELWRKPMREAARKVELYNKDIPIALKYLVNSPELSDKDEVPENMHVESSEEPQFPYKLYTSFDIDEKSQTDGFSQASEVGKHRPEHSNQENIEEECNEDIEGEVQYGLPNPDIPASSVPCGGCGAFLHCQDTAIPGFMPAESFTAYKGHDLQGEICQRCFNLKHYNVALNVNVSPDMYPKVLMQMQKHFAMVLLVVDLLDFPCSIWPNIIDIIGTKRPVIIVGNKVDLLPRDSKNYLDNIHRCLENVISRTDLCKANIIGAELVSATTGFGIENLITKIYGQWGNKGDIFIMGCTNVGKSSLFNAFLQSDLCKVQVADLVQRATVSPWPGTTLNLLKFPILSAHRGWRKTVRHFRLKDDEIESMNERESRLRLMKQTKNPLHGTLIGKVGQSFLKHQKLDAAQIPDPNLDMFHVNPKTKNFPMFVKKVGKWNRQDPALIGNWCYDTPGAVGDNQILDLLTLPELMKILPKEMIKPRSYYVKLGTTVFIGGIARIDYIDGCQPIRFTVFSSTLVPITVCESLYAEDIYRNALGTPILGVPMGSSSRLEKFPPLKSTEFELEGINHRESCADIVISSTGFVAVTAGYGNKCRLAVHTPNGKGTYCREPSLVPLAVNYKGKRIRDTPAYSRHRIYIPPHISIK